MKAIAMTFQTGESRAVELPKPVLTSPKDVLIKVKYSAVDTTVKEVVDKTMTGYFVHSRSNPLIVGWHYSGTVIAIGAQAETYLQVGDEVWGFLDYSPKQKQGAFSEFITVEASKCARLPDGVDPKVAKKEQCTNNRLNYLLNAPDIRGLARILQRHIVLPRQITLAPM